jgi:hypothetical protein
VIEVICRLISGLFNLFSSEVWIAVIIIGTVVFKLAGETIGAFLKVVLMALIAYGLLCVVGWLLPTWLENLIFVALVIGIVWAKA